jgi:hypothetical protein
MQRLSGSEHNVLDHSIMSISAVNIAHTITNAPMSARV